jgi:protein TonB
MHFAPMNKHVILAGICLILVQYTALSQAAATPDVKDTAKKISPKVEKPAEFPGGAEGWRSYLEKNLRYPKKARREEIQGVVRVQFVVDRDGVVKEITPLNDPGGGLAEEAVRIIAKGPNWVPAEQNGKKVIYLHVQSITFRLE